MARIEPAGCRSNAFRELVRVLGADPGLRVVVKTWKTWEGSPADEQPPASGNMPWVRLTPVGLPALRKGQYAPNLPGVITLSPLRVLVETAVAGPRIDDAMNLWERFEAALWPADHAARTALVARFAAVGVRDVRLLQPALPTGVDNVSAALIVSDGAIQLDLYLAL